jgi:hypothetical protein
MRGGHALVVAIIELAIDLILRKNGMLGIWIDLGLGQRGG